MSDDGKQSDPSRAMAGAGPGGAWSDPRVRLAVVIGLAWVVAYGMAAVLIGGREPAALILGDVVYLVPVAAATLLSAIAARRTSGRRRAFWVVLAVSNGIWLAGEVTWSVYELGLDIEVPFPSVADAFYVTSYALVPAAIVVGFGGPVRVRMWRPLLDASIVVVAVGFAGFALLVSPQLEFGLSLATVVGIAYPVLGVAILMVLLTVGLAGHRDVPPSVALVGLAFACSALTDAAYTYAAVLHAYVSGDVLGTGWQLEAVLLSAAALMAFGGRETEASRRILPHDVGLVPVAVGVAATVALVVVDSLTGDPTPGPVLVAVYAVGALVLRLYLTSREKDRIARELERSVGSLREVEQERTRLLDRMLETAEKERARLAMDLHDGAIQHLTAMMLQVERARRYLGRQDLEQGQDLLLGFGRMLAEEIGGLRRVMVELRPPALDEEGLEGALRDHVEAFGEQAGIASTFRSSLAARPDPEVETVLYRVAQEALANVAKHARASRADVSLREVGGSTLLEVSDDGSGFSPQRAAQFARDGHFGLLAMRERVEMAGGRLEIDSRPGAGTTVRARFERSRVATR